MGLAWGKRVSADFRANVANIAQDLRVDPDFLMAAMAFESGETFSPSIRNAAGSGAVGLIQFMPQTALGLGTTTEELAAMTAEQQLLYVHDYFKPKRGRLNTLSDVYMTILWPAAVGKPEEFVLFDKADAEHPKRYVQNAGLDIDRNGRVTKAEAASRVQAKLDKGRRPENCAE